MINRRRFLQRLAGSTAMVWMTQGCARGGSTGETRTPLPNEATSASVPLLAQSNQLQPLRVGFTAPPKQMNPAFSAMSEEYQLGFALYDGLVWVDENLTPQPLLANSWQATPNLLVWTFKLERGVSFHHGAPCTAKDVVYTFKQILDPTYGSAFRSVLSFIKTVEALDDYTVRFVLSSANVELPVLLGSPQASIICHSYPASRMSAQPSGTGPFTFVEYIVDDRIRLARNHNYWAAEGKYVEQLEYIYRSYPEQIVLLKSGELDVLSTVDATDFRVLYDDPAIQFESKPSGSYQTIVMQVTEKPFSDLRVRQALKACADHDALEQQVLLGKGLVGNNQPVPSISPFWADLPKHQQDIAKAKDLLNQAGYSNGLKLDLITSNSIPGMVELANAFREMAQLAGIEIHVVEVPADVYWTDYWNKAPFHVGSWGFRPSLDETFMAGYHSNAKFNESRWQNEELDQLIDQARAERDETKRKALYQQAQALIAADGGVIIPYFRPMSIALRQGITGFVLHPAGWLDFSTVEMTNGCSDPQLINCSPILA